MTSRGNVRCVWAAASSPTFFFLLCLFPIPANGRGRPSKRVVTAVVATVAGVLLLLAVGCCVWRKRRKRQCETDSSAPAGGEDVLPFRAGKHPALEEDWKCAKKDVDLPLFDLEVILAATDNFALDNKIGEGGFGPVYMVRFEQLALG